MIYSGHFINYIVVFHCVIEHTYPWHSINTNVLYIYNDIKCRNDGPLNNQEGPIHTILHMPTDLACLGARIPRVSDESPMF